MFYLHLLTFHVLINILSNVLCHFRPKILLSSCTNCFLISWVTRIWSLMDFIYNNPPQVCHIWNRNYILISKDFVSLQLISFVLPFKVLLLQLVLYLQVHLILDNMVHNLLPQIWLASTKICHMHFMYLRAKCIIHLVFFLFYVFDFKINFTQKFQPCSFPSI